METTLTTISTEERIDHITKYSKGGLIEKTCETQQNKIVALCFWFFVSQIAFFARYAIIIEAQEKQIQQMRSCLMSCDKFRHSQKENS